MSIELLAPARLAKSSVRRFVSLAVHLCSLGLVGASGGSDELKFHSSSSFETLDFGGVGVFENPSAANGSCANLGAVN